MKRIYLLFFLLIISCKNSDVSNDIVINQRPLYEHPWYSEEGSLNDSILIPQIIESKLYVKNIQGFETNKEYYILEAENNIYTDYTDYIVDHENDTIFNPFDKDTELIFKYDESETFYQTIKAFELSMNEQQKKIKKRDTIFEVVDVFEGKMFHNWDLRKYPFDDQKLRISVKSFADTTLVRLKQSSIFPSIFKENNDLKQGFRIEKIDFKEEFLDDGLYDEYLKRNIVSSVGVYEVTISRSGSWVFIKLFFGGILSLVLSWLVFLIPLKDFASRIELSIGAVFAAVGNKYFVDAATDSQVLTVADMFNNIIILMVVLNVGLVIIKRNPVFTNKRLNDTQTLSRFSIITAFVLFTLLFLYTIF